MIDKPLISIIVPCYNGEKYLSDCLDSLLLQTYKNIEVIIVNDGSKDNSQDIIDAYLNKDSRLKSIYQENAGLPGARNTGLDGSIGEYVTFVDCDDDLPPDAIDNLYNEIGDCELAVGSYTELWLYKKPIVYKRERFDGVSKAECFLDYIDKTVIVCKNLYKKSVIDENNLRFDKSMRFAEDYYFNINYLKCINSLIISDKQVYNYYTYRSAQHRRYFPDFYKYYCRVLDAANSFFDKKEYKDEYKKYFVSFYLETLIYYYSFNVKNKNEAEEYIFKSFDSLKEYFNEDLIKECLSEKQFECLNYNNAKGFIKLHYPDIKYLKLKANLRDTLLDLKMKTIK